MSDLRPSEVWYVFGRRGWRWIIRDVVYWRDDTDDVPRSDMLFTPSDCPHWQDVREMGDAIHFAQAFETSHARHPRGFALSSKDPLVRALPAGSTERERRDREAAVRYYTGQTSTRPWPRWGVAAACANLHPDNRAACRACDRALLELRGIAASIEE